MKAKDSLKIVDKWVEHNVILFVPVYLLFVSFLNGILKILLVGEFNLSLSYFYINTLVFSISFFFFLVIIHYFSDNSSVSRSIMRLSSIFFLFVFAPILTVIFGGTISHLNLMGWFTTLEILSFETDVNVGLTIIYLILFLIGIRIWIDSEGSVLKKLTSSLAGIVLSFIGFLAVFSQLYLFRIKGNEVQRLLSQRHIGFILLLLSIQLFVVVSIFMLFWKREILKNYISNMKVLRSIHFVTMTGLGFIVLSQLDYNMFEFTDPINLTFFILPSLCMVLTWQFTAMVNDIYDIEIDRVVHPQRPLVTGKIDRSTYRDTAIVLATLSFLISLYFGILLALLNLTFILAGIMYSRPPLRLKERVYGYICVGYASFVAFFFGVYSPIFWSLAVEQGRWFLVENVPFFSEAFSISLIIFIALSISPYINALSDYEGDKKSGVKNIYTIYGREKGKKIVTVLIIFLFLSPISLFYDLFDLAVFLPFSLISANIYYFYENHRSIFVLYFIVILYSVIRYIGLL